MSMIKCTTEVIHEYGWASFWALCAIIYICNTLLEMYKYKK